MSVNCKSSYNCPVEATIDLIGGKYKSVILWHLKGKTVVPPKTEYSLTDFGNTLAPILDAMCDWGTVYLDEVSTTPACRKSKK